MIRKGTWILIAVFAVLLAGAFYLQKNPMPAGGGTATPSPTAEPAAFLAGWNTSDIVAIDLKEGQNSTIQLAQDEKGAWQLGAQKTPVDPGKVEQVRSEIVSMRPTRTLPTDFAREAAGLTNPARTLTIRNKSGQQVVMRIGNPTPTGTGYYMQVDDQAPVVVAQGSVDGIVSPLTSLVATPTPAATVSQPTATP